MAASLIDTLTDAFRVKPKAAKTPPKIEADKREPVTAAESQADDSPIESAHVKRVSAPRRTAEDLYKAGRSFVDFLPWVEALEGEKAILLEDNRSVGAVFELTPRGTEGRPEAHLVDIRDSIEAAFQDVFDEHDDSPWIVQTFTFNELELDEFTDSLRAYPGPLAKGTEFTEQYLNIVDRHCKDICRPGGLFTDTEVTQTPWGGRRQRNYVVIYRRQAKSKKKQVGSLTIEEALDSLNETCDKFYNALVPSGIQFRRLTGREFHQWMMRWFNAYTDITPDHPVAFSNLVDCDEDETVPYGDRFTETMFYSYPKSDHDNNAWRFDETVSRCIAVDGIRKRPSIGQSTGETRRGDAINTMMDQMPEGTVMASTIVVTPNDTVELHIDQIDSSAIGTSTDASRTKADCAEAKSIMGERHKMYRAAYSFYIRSTSMRDLNVKTNKARAVLLAHGFRAVSVKDDIRSLDNYISGLPMVYDASADKSSGWRLTNLMWVQHIANLSPFFGRSTGTGHPGVLQFNRGGEPFVFDPMNKLDRKKNAHMMILGPTGAGKSVTMAGILSHTIAMYRPRMFVIEAGNSFGLTSEWWESLGVSVNRVSLKPGSGITLPTFADAHLILEDEADVSVDLEDAPLADHDDDDDAERDILGEMEIIATLMITGGEQKEADRLHRSDRRIIRDAILLGARQARSAGATTMTSDVRDGFYEIAKDETRTPDARQKIREMGDAIGFFCDGFAGEIFNRPGVAWPESDVTLVDLGHFAKEGYEAHLAISVISLLNMVNNIAERDQHSGRQIVAAIDEAHIVTTNPLLSPYLVKIVKMWRKLGAWLWLATQNMKDFPNNAQKLLNMIEWWVCLVMPKDEVEDVERFKNLSEEQKEMLLSASKADRKFTEGVVLSDDMNSLFRCVPPSLMLALAMTESHEKSERAALMREHGVDEVAAAIRMAAEIDKARGISR